MDWVTRFREPFFRTLEEAETYVTRELAQTVPQGWAASCFPGERLTWQIKKERPDPGEWPNQEYGLRISSGLDFMILTHGNSDEGAVMTVRHALLNAFVIETVMLRRFSLGECLSFLFRHCKPNEWGYT